MNKKFIQTLFLLVAVSTSLFAQIEPTSNGTNKGNIKASPVPMEQVYVHLNASLFFVGEYLYYKMYTINTRTENLTTLSKVGYLELINENKESVFKQKIMLASGSGQGDFFIPTTIPSGNYKIVSYTMHMLSKASDNYFQQDISIINPYKGNQNAVTKNEKRISEKNTMSGPALYKSTEEDEKWVALTTDKERYSKRSLVSLAFKNLNNKELSGTYSISVRKIDTVRHSSLHHATGLKKLYNDKNSATERQLIIPELRGEILSGTIKAKSENVKTNNQKVALSIPGDNFIFKISNVDSNGKFYFNIDEPYSENKASLQVIGDTDKIFNIEVDQQTPISFEKLRFDHFYITPPMKEMIIKRSVDNQVENGYYSVKPDTIKTIPADTSIYKKRSTVYNLDEYTRFPTMEETMVEIVNDAWINKRNDKSAFFIREKENSLPTTQPALLLVDGVFVQDHEDLINYKANKVASISIVQDKYFYGSEPFQGIMFVETIDGNFYENLSKGYIKKITLNPAQRKKQYFKQQYSNRLNKTSHIPDYRRQLLWQPALTIDGSSKKLTFYTSDISGTFEISLEGFTEVGNPISIKETFTVE